MTDTEMRFLRWRDGLSMAAPPMREMDLRPLLALLVDNGLRIRSGRAEHGTLILDLEADRFEGGGMWVHELPAGHDWQIRRGRCDSPPDVGVIVGDDWEIRVPVAEEPK